MEDLQLRDREEDVAVRTRVLEKKRTITNTQKGEQSDREQRVKRDKQDHRDSFKKERRPCLDGFFFLTSPPLLSPRRCHLNHYGLGRIDSGFGLITDTDLCPVAPFHFHLGYHTYVRQSENNLIGPILCRIQPN